MAKKMKWYNPGFIFVLLGIVLAPLYWIIFDGSGAWYDFSHVLSGSVIGAYTQQHFFTRIGAITLLVWSFFGLLAFEGGDRQITGAKTSQKLRIYLGLLWLLEALWWVLLGKTSSLIWVILVAFLPGQARDYLKLISRTPAFRRPAWQIKLPAGLQFSYAMVYCFFGLLYYAERSGLSIAPYWLALILIAGYLVCLWHYAYLGNPMTTVAISLLNLDWLINTVGVLGWAHWLTLSLALLLIVGLLGQYYLFKLQKKETI